MRSERKVVLNGLPPGFLDDLPEEDQKAISAVIGTAIQFSGYDDDGRAELRFVATNGTFHTIYVDRQYIGTTRDLASLKKRRR